MEVKLSAAEVTQIATEVVRLMQQSNSVSKVTPATNRHKAESQPRVKSPSQENPAVPPVVEPAVKIARGKAKANVAPIATSVPNKVVTNGASASNGTSASNGLTYTIDEAAEVKGCHPNTIRRAVKAGKLAGKMGKAGKYQITQRDLDKFAL